VVLWGAADAHIPVSHGHAFAGGIPGARLHVVTVRDGAGLVGVLPLFLSRVGAGPLAGSTLQPISYDPVNRQDYANPTGLVGWYGEFAAFREAVPESWPANEPSCSASATRGFSRGASSAVIEGMLRAFNTAPVSR
jgi:hypothetical protein